MARDYTKYNVEGLGENLNKRKLVFTIVKDLGRKKQSKLLRSCKRPFLMKCKAVKRVHPQRG